VFFIFLRYICYSSVILPLRKELAINLALLRMKKRMIFFCAALLASICCSGQSQWTLKARDGDIEIYTKNVENSPFKAIKVRCTISATLSQLVAVILDVNTGADWVYSTKSSTLLKQVTPAE